MTDTIGAIATGRGPSAIGVIRLSGPGAIGAVEAVFRPVGGKAFRDTPDRRLVLGELTDREGRVIDQALATLSHGPHSYTGEDTAELQCHGGPVVLALAMEALFAQGVRQAQAGEFTKRAFLNGRLDLTRAEAVIDLIDAETPAAARCAAGQLSGALARRLEEIYEGLTDVSAHFCAVLDYTDEDIDPFRQETVAAALDRAGEQVDRLLASYDRGRRLARGVPCAIIGRPNVGKSSLLNALVGFDRAIVTHIPGTTRDTIEETCTVGGVLLRLVDTAGLRETGDEVERLGMERSRRAAAEAELVLALVDGSVPLTDGDREVLAVAAKAPWSVCVVNKSDLPLAVDVEEIKGLLPQVCVVSAKEERGLAELEGLVAGLIPQETEEGAGQLLTNQRQYSAALAARRALDRAVRDLEAGMSPDGVLFDVEEAMTAIGELTGRTVREDVTDRVFARFCVGK